MRAFSGDEEGVLQRGGKNEKGCRSLQGRRILVLKDLSGAKNMLIYEWASRASSKEQN